MSPTGTKDRNFEEVHILIIDDDDISIRAVKRAITKMKLANPIRVAHDGLQGLEVLRGEAGEDQLMPPYVVLLDINMPRMNGHEFLAELRGDPKLRQAIVFVMTTSDAPKDVMAAYDMNIAGYVVKEDIFESFRKTLEVVDLFSKLIVFPK